MRLEGPEAGEPPHSKEAASRDSILDMVRGREDGLLMSAHGCRVAALGNRDAVCIHAHLVSEVDRVHSERRNASRCYRAVAPPCSYLWKTLTSPTRVTLLKCRGRR